jgi:hypothetical protein
VSLLAELQWSIFPDVDEGQFEVGRGFGSRADNTHLTCELVKFGVSAGSVGIALVLLELGPVLAHG